MPSHLVRVRVPFLVFLLLVSSMAACAGLGTQKEIPLTPVPITNIKEVEGTWEGLVKNVRTGRDAGRIALVLTARDTYGSYSFGGDTVQGYIVGTGRLTVQNGQLLSDMGQRTVVLTNCLRGNEKVVAAYVFGKDGNLYYMELTQMK